MGILQGLLTAFAVFIFGIQGVSDHEYAGEQRIDMAERTNAIDHLGCQTYAFVDQQHTVEVANRASQYHAVLGFLGRNLNFDFTAGSGADGPHVFYQQLNKFGIKFFPLSVLNGFFAGGV